MLSVKLVIFGALVRKYFHFNVSFVICTDIVGDPTLPLGWKIKKYKSKSDSTRVHCEYLSPHNQVGIFGLMTKQKFSNLNMFRCLDPGKLLWNT